MVKTGTLIKKLLKPISARAVAPIRVEEGTPPRRIHDHACDDLKSIITNIFPKDRPWRITCAHGDAESCSFAQEIRDFMSTEEFDFIDGGIIRTVFERPRKGISIEKGHGYYILVVGTNDVGPVSLLDPKVAARQSTDELVASNQIR